MSQGNIYIIYGVSGCGKTTVGKALAKELSLPFYDADDYHPQTNIDKMSLGISLNDKDRAPWLLQLGQEIRFWHREGGAVLACSALKKAYRDTLEIIDKDYLQWVFLDGSSKVIEARLKNRKEHFFNRELLRSQFETLETPDRGIQVRVGKSVESIVAEIMGQLNISKVVE